MGVEKASGSKAGKVCPDQEVLITPPPQTLLCQPLLEVFLDFFFFFLRNQQISMGRCVLGSFRLQGTKRNSVTGIFVVIYIFNLSELSLQPYSYIHNFVSFFLTEGSHEHVSFGIHKA